jgi:hypothetical protein
VARTPTADGVDGVIASAGWKMRAKAV